MPRSPHLCFAMLDPVLPGAGDVHQSGGRLQTCPLVLVSLFDFFPIPAPPFAGIALRTNCGNVLPCLWKFMEVYGLSS